jgi:Arc/MetJ family transcription regulator
VRAERYGYANPFYWGDIVKRTNVVLDDDLIEDCIKVTGIKTRKALIDQLA